MASIYRLTTDANIGVTATPTTLYTAPTGITAVVLGLTLCNKSANTAQVSVFIESDTATSENTGGTAANENVTLIKDVTINAGIALELMEGQKYIMQPTDVIKVSSDIASSVDATLSYMERS